MSDAPAITVENISKLYMLFPNSKDRLKQILFHRFGGNYGHPFWALKDVSFSVERGKTLGIVGRNGSGKSTLLQIMAGILQPTKGVVRVNGRVTALLELGAGFSPEFTGRENIFINGSVLGISQAELNERLDEIIAFADIGEFIDQPVKIYSSGMYVRLAFAISASLSPDVLIIDEALAVGDAGFIIKCMNRIEELKKGGTTILLVTHDVQTVRSLCDSAIWLDHGQIMEQGNTREVTSKYVKHLFAETSSSKSTATVVGHELIESVPTSGTIQVQLNQKKDLIRWGSGEIQSQTCVVRSEHLNSDTPILEFNQPVEVIVQATALQDVPSTHIGLGIGFRNLKGLDIITSTTYDVKNYLPSLKAGERVRVSFQFVNILSPGDYALVVNVEDRSAGVPQYYDFIENALLFKVVSQHHIFSAVLPPVDQKIELIQ